MAEAAEGKNNRLSASEVGKALRAGEPVTLKDGGSLSLVVTGKNAGKWVFIGRKAGDRTNIKLICGYAPETGLSAARAKRDEYRLLLKQGINPNEQRREELAEAKRKKQEAEKTFSVVAGEYFRIRKDMTEKTRQGDMGRVENHINPFIKNIPIVDIRRKEHLKPIIDKLVAREAHTQARRVAGLIERIFSYAVDAGYIQGTPADHLTRLVPRQGRGETKHHPAITGKEEAAAMFRKLWAYMESGRSGPSIVAAMRLSCYLPVRNGNMIAARWEDIDLKKGLWTFSQTKNGRGYTVPLSRQMKEVFTALAMFRRGAWCFPSGSNTGHVSNGGLIKVLRAAGIPQGEHCLHGFRSTFETLALEAGIPKLICERALFHVAGDSTEQAYNRAEYMEPLGLVLQWWADTVDALRDGEELPSMPDKLIAAYR